MLDISSTVPNGFKLKQSKSTVIHIRYNFQPLKDFISKKDAKIFLEKFFYETVPQEASPLFMKEMIIGINMILNKI